MMQLTWADLDLVAINGWLGMVDGAQAKLDDYPKLKALLERTTKTPKVAEWLEKRPKTMF